MANTCESNCGIWLDDVAMLLLGVGVVASWWATKKLAVEFDRPGLWDGADLAFGIAAAAALFTLQLAALGYKPTATGPPIWLIAMRRAAIMAWQAPVVLWFVSVWIEVETDRAAPASLEPIADRVWDRQLCWVPLEDPRDG